MNPSDQELLKRWLPRLADRSDDVKVKAIETLTEVALRNSEQRNLIVPKLLEVGRNADEWILANGFLAHSSEIPRVDANWAEDFFEVYFSIAQKRMEIASRRAFKEMLPLLESRAVDGSGPLVASAYADAKQQLEGSSDDFLRGSLFAIADWYEDNQTDIAASGKECALEANQAFQWPITDAPSSGSRLNGGIFVLESGVLRTLGYVVGVTNGKDAATRRRLLTNFLELAPSLPEDHPQALEWGAPGSSTRLLKLANTIAAFARNAKRRRQRPDVAIAEWEADLAYLKKSFYDGVFDFHWPSTNHRRAEAP